MSQALMHPDQALDIIRATAPMLGSEQVAIDDAIGRITAAAVTSPCALPPFDNSAMDGFALAGGDAPLAAGTIWPIEGRQAAGDAASHADHGAWEIMTGARLPEGLDRVIPVERTDTLDAPARVRLNAEVARWKNVRRAGSDIAQGDAILDAGTLFGPQHLMLAAALGISTLPVVRQPRVAVLSTGHELIDDASQALGSGQIRNSNGPFLAARLPRAGAKVVHSETVGDKIEPFLEAFQRAREADADIVISTGAVSMGRYDFVPQALERLGATVLFHKLAVRPGKPQLFARLPDGTLFFGLPGNPIAAAVGLRFFVEPALRVMLNLPPETPWRVPLSAAYAKKPPLRFHLKSRLAMAADGQLGITMLPGQQSYRIGPLAAANAWAVAPLEASQLDAGTLVDVYGLGHLESPLLDRSHA